LEEDLVFSLTARGKDGTDQGLALVGYNYNPKRRRLTAHSVRSGNRNFDLAEFESINVFGPDGNVVWCKAWAVMKNTAKRPATFQEYS
jgi:hypothetical protein